MAVLREVALAAVPQVGDAVVAVVYRWRFDGLVVVGGRKISRRSSATIRNSSRYTSRAAAPVEVCFRETTAL